MQTSSPWAVTLSWHNVGEMSGEIVEGVSEEKRLEEIFRGIIRGRRSGRNVRIPIRITSLCAAVMICTNLVNTQTHTETAFDLLYYDPTQPKSVWFDQEHNYA